MTGNTEPTPIGPVRKSNNVITIEASDLVYKNPRPDLHAIGAQFPSLVLLGDKEFLATFDLRQADRPLDYHTVVSRSMDGGETWTLEAPMLRQRPSNTTHSIRTSRLSDGSLVGLGLLNYIEDPQVGVLNRATYGRAPGDLFLVRSMDAGRSWTDPAYIEPPLVGPSWEICHHIVELADGRWLAPTATWRGWNGENPSGDQSPVFISDNRGRTWPTFGRCFDGRTTLLTYWEQSVVQLQDGRLLAVSWVYDMETGATHPNQYSISEDRGETFSEPMPTGFYAQTCKLIQLHDGRLLCAYRRHDQTGLWATMARLEGSQWNNLSHAALWQGAESGMSGKGKAADELRSLKFGYPSMKQLSSGEVLLLFWCEEDGITNTRWIRLNVDSP